jgi:hypothetical protein
MGKKRRFKRDDEKKGSGSGFLPASQQPPPGIIMPGEITYIDRRPEGSYVAPTPPTELTADEIELERVNREWLARKAARKAEEDLAKGKIAAASEEAPATPPKDSSIRAFPNKAQSALDAGTVDLPMVPISEVKLANPGQPARPLSEDASARDEAESAEIVENSESEAKDENDEVDSTPPRVVEKRKSIAELLEEASTDVEMEATRRTLLAAAWRERDKVYQQLFGKPAYVTPSTYREPTTEVPADFGKREAAKGTDTGNPGDPDMEDQHLAVLAYGPDPETPYWKYVTAGLASPWHQYEPQQASGFGCELMIKSPVDAPWAAQFLRTLAFYIFNYAGVLSQGVRLRLNSPIDPASDSDLRNAFVWYADEAPDTLYELPSGLFSILLVCGITDEELKFADSVEEYGTWCVQALLRQAGYHQITDPKRECSTKKENINEMKMSVRNFAETFRANREGRFTADDTSFT